jgi:hypothetical protein
MQMTVTRRQKLLLVGLGWLEGWYTLEVGLERWFRSCRSRWRYASSKNRRRCRRRGRCVWRCRCVRRCARRRWRWRHSRQWLARNRWQSNTTWVGSKRCVGRCIHHVVVALVTHELPSFGLDARKIDLLFGALWCETNQERREPANAHEDGQHECRDKRLDSV